MIIFDCLSFAISEDTSYPISSGVPSPLIIYNELPELLELLYFAECSSLFSTADRFDFFKNKREMGEEQRINVQKLGLRIKTSSRHIVK